MSYEVINLQNNIWSGRFSHFPEEVAIHGVSCRIGGRSTGDYASLNVALHVGDDAAAVVANRRLYLEALGLQADNICTPQQVHGCRVYRVIAQDRGRGARDYADSIAATDALITNESNLPLLLCSADCALVIFLDPVKQVAGIAHAGWKGTVSLIGQKTVQAMVEEYGCRPEDILAGVGPSIGPCCFEVGQEVADKFTAVWPQGVVEIVAGKPHVNLWEANRLQLLAAGVPAQNIQVAGECTFCHHDRYFSYRADNGKTGRIGAVIALK